MYRELFERTDFVIEGDEIQQMKMFLNKSIIKIMGKHALRMFETKRKILYENMSEEECGEDIDAVEESE